MAEKPALTDAQHRVLAAITEITADGWPANVREIQRATGYANPSSVFNHILSLERLGLVEKHPRWRGGVRLAGNQHPTGGVS